MNPKHSISLCPICGGGLCGVRICDGPLAPTHASCNPPIDDDPMRDGPKHHRQNSDLLNDAQRIHNHSIDRHGLVVCDECEAIWLSPDTDTDHLYPDPENARCPVCRNPLWGQASHWASIVEVDELGWLAAVNRKLDVANDESAR